MKLQDITLKKAKILGRICTCYDTYNSFFAGITSFAKWNCLLLWKNITTMSVNSTFVGEKLLVRIKFANKLNSCQAQNPIQAELALLSLLLQTTRPAGRPPVEKSLNHKQTKLRKSFQIIT